MKKQAERAKRQEEQMKLERRLAALKSEPPEQRQNSLAPVVPNMQFGPRGAWRGPRRSPCCGGSGGPRCGQSPAGGNAGGTCIEHGRGKGRDVGAEQGVAAHARPRASREVAAQRRGCREHGECTVDEQGRWRRRGTRDRNRRSGCTSAGAIAQWERCGCGARERAAATRVAAHASQREDGQAERYLRLHGEAGDRRGCAGRCRKSTPKATEPAAKPDGTQQAAKREAPAEKPADDAKNKAPMQPADALNIARVVLNVQ